MGRFDFEFPVEFMKQLGRLADVEKYAPKMLEESAPILVRTVKSALTGVISTGSSGDMVRSVKSTKVFHNKYGYFLTVRPTGKDKNGIRNMEKAAYLEYGTHNPDSSGWHQSPNPWAVKSQNDARAEVLNKMKEVFEREVK